MLNLQHFLSNALEEIERREARLLVWGIVDASFTYDEIAGLLNPVIDRALAAGFEEFSSTTAALQGLLRFGLVAEVERARGEVGYRSRMAETIRLLFRLRQLFPKHARPGAWQQAPTLVADFRFQRRPRSYPRRDIDKDALLGRLRSITSNAALLAGAKALLVSDDNDVKLAGFQVRAAERIVRSIESQEPLSTIVCAGTGSGKTLAFYLPALASIARHKSGGGVMRPWVKAIAIYPRTELLKDQLREVLARSAALCSQLNISISVGALFGDTPASARWCNWARIGNDFICPLLRCIHCNGQLRWLHENHNVGRERLTCADCRRELDGTALLLTRDSLKANPPDVLFTTTEMLNQRLADNTLRHLFGVGSKAERLPEVVLLDEAHTYDGRHGAQVAYLMRRWQGLAEQPLRFVGLSATLREAPAFFASLIGSRLNRVEEIAPHTSEIEREGAEYMLALRGDPVSRTALLSTTIQTTMLLQRCLDSRTAELANSTSGGAFGQRTFVFTDNLDVVNRLYFDLLNAEGRTSAGQPAMRNAPAGGLAVLRNQGASLSRYQNGQDWRFCESLGHQLSDRLVVERVSSQDRGIDANADVVVATAALEVGFDDPSVGAVIQHKAPRSVASFLQRKGRAGRTRGMRPWTAVVLSDYGRDRVVYQGYDLLFDPELQVRTLPLSNRYITRMQAVFATLDFLGQRLEDAPAGSVWNDLAGPTNELRAARLQKELRLVLESESGTKRLQGYLTRALKLSAAEVSALFWEYPRPLMTTVLPTALRRLATRWHANGQAGADLQVRNNPLPEFVPATLFADLNLAEVRIDIAQAGSGRQDEQPAMAVFAALNEFAPGRVSRRFGVRYRTERHWVAPSFDQSLRIVQPSLDIDTFASCIGIGEFNLNRNGVRERIAVYRPTKITPGAPPATVADSSQGRLHWQSEFVRLGDPICLAPPADSVWRKVSHNLQFFLHAHHAPIEVRRFATGSELEIGMGRAPRIRADVEFEKNGRAAALGATFSADGLLLEVHTPNDLHAVVGSESAAKWRALRTIRFLDMAWRGEALATVPSPFMRQWLAQIYLSALTYEAINNGVDLATAAGALLAGTAHVRLHEVLAVLFQSIPVEEQPENGEQPSPDKLRQELEQLLHNGSIVNELHYLGQMLWGPLTAEWEPWLRSMYLSTLAAALLRSITDLCPTLDVEDLFVDIEFVSEGAATLPRDTSTSKIWITEKSPGGNGIIEDVLQVYAEDPRRFFSMVRANLEMGEFELIDHQLRKLLLILTGEGDSPLRQLVTAFRAATTHQRTVEIAQQLRLAFVREGFSPFHGFMVSVGSRILRPGTGPATDRYLANVLQHWEREELRLGIEIDLRVMCYSLSQSADIDTVIAEVGLPKTPEGTAWRMNTIYGLLWGRGRAIRQSSLQLRNPFSDLPEIERLLVVESVSDERVRVSVDAAEWFQAAAVELAAGNLVTLICDAAQRALLGDALGALITNPIDVGYLRAYARLQAVRQSSDIIEADIELIEALQ